MTSVSALIEMLMSFSRLPTDLLLYLLKCMQNVR